MPPIRVVSRLFLVVLLLGAGSSGAFAEPDSALCPLIKADPCGRTGLFRDSCISIEQLRQKQLNAERVLVLDSRSRNSYAQSHIEGSILSHDSSVSLEQNLKNYPKDMPIVVYCGVGCQTSSAVVLQIKRMGFKNAKVLEDGFQVWQEKGYPVSQGT